MKLISAVHKATLSFKDLHELILSSGSIEWNSTIKYEVDVFEIIYWTNYLSINIRASGLLYLPRESKVSMPILCLQHGTIFLKSEAPSLCIGFAGGELICSAGYIVIQSDYIGYGASSEYFHPYYDKNYGASSVTDMILASMQYVNDIKFKHNNKLFLAGYSEGGYITLAVQSHLEKSNDTNLSLQAIAAGAGGYDLFSLLAEFTTGTGSHVQPSYIVFLLMAYEYNFNWNKSLEYFFAKKYAELVPELMNGNYSSTYINFSLSNNLKELFNPDFYSNLMGSGEMDLKKALFINSLSEWQPLSPLRLYHGTMDDVIPYSNTEITYQKFIAKGCKNIKFLSIPNGNHQTSKAPMIDSVIKWFKEFN